MSRDSTILSLVWRTVEKHCVFTINRKLYSSNLNQLNSEFVFETAVRNIANLNYQYFKKDGYILIAAANGDFNTCNTHIKSVSRQGTTDIVFLEEIVNGFYRFNLLWAKE